MSLDFSCVLDRLCIGSAPAKGHQVHAAGFDLLLLCAAELQDASSHDFPGVEVWHCGYEDGPLDPELVDMLAVLSADVADAWAKGRSILVTCALGKNRSSLVVALAYRLITGVSGHDAARDVRAARPGALFNPAFARYLDELRPL